MSATLKVTVQCDGCGRVISRDETPLRSVISMAMALGPSEDHCQVCADGARAARRARPSPASSPVTDNPQEVAFYKDIDKTASRRPGPGRE